MPAVLVLAGDRERQRAHDWVKRAPLNSRVSFQGPRRSLDQNAKMWALLTELSLQLDWHNQRYSPDDWKDYLMHALRKARWMPDEDGGMVPIGMRTSSLSKEDMAELIELLYAFGSRHGVIFADPT